MTREEIIANCEDYRINNYTINDDMTINVEGDVNLYVSGLDIFPVNFNRVNGNFLCHENTLTTLKGAPKYVRSNFECDFNDLTSLEYSPEYVGGDFMCEINNITSLKGPKIIQGRFFCGGNKLKVFDYMPSVKNEVYFNSDEIDDYDDENPIDQLWQYFENKKYIDYFIELDIVQENGTTVILDRLNYFLTDIGKDEVSKDNIKKYKVK